MNIRIAVIEQFPQIRLLFQAILTPAGYDVVSFEQDENSLQHLKALEPDLIILGDIRLSAENELQFFNTLRTQPETQAIPLIIATTSTPRLLESPLLEDVTELHVLYKPFQHQQLLDCVANALKQGKTRRILPKSTDGTQAAAYG